MNRVAAFPAPRRGFFSAMGSCLMAILPDADTRPVPIETLFRRRAT